MSQFRLKQDKMVSILKLEIMSSQDPKINKSQGWKPAKRVLQVCKEEGVKSLCFKILGETIYRRLILLERPLHEPFKEVLPQLPVDFHLLKESDIDEYIRFRSDQHAPEICHRLSEKQMCFVGRYQGRIVHAAWAVSQQAWIDYLSCDIFLASDEVYVYDTFTLSEFRGKNIAPARSAYMMRYLQKTGYRRVVGAVLPENIAGLRVPRKSDYRRFGVIGYVKIGRWRWKFCRTDRESLRSARSRLDGIKDGGNSG